MQTLTSPQGTKVTVPQPLAEKLKLQGYTPTTRKPATTK